MTDYMIGDWRKLGAVLRDKRRQHGFTQTELAELAGVSRAWLARLEMGGHRRAEIEHVLRLLAALGIDMLLRDTGDGQAVDDGAKSPIKSIQKVAPIHSTNDAIDGKSREADARMRAARAALDKTPHDRGVDERHRTVPGNPANTP